MAGQVGGVRAPPAGVTHRHPERVPLRMHAAQALRSSARKRVHARRAHSTPWQWLLMQLLLLIIML